MHLFLKEKVHKRTLRNSNAYDLIKDYFLKFLFFRRFFSLSKEKKRQKKG